MLNRIGVALVAIALLLPSQVTPQQQRRNDYGSVAGVVLDDEGRFIRDATVYALPEKDMRKQLTTSTDEQGRFLLKAVPTGSVYIDAYKENDGLPHNFFAFFKTTDRLPSRSMCRKAMLPQTL